MADLITHLLTISKLDKSDKMDCSFWSTFGEPPHPVEWFKLSLHTMIRVNMKRDMKPLEQLTPDLIILHFPSSTAASCSAPCLGLGMAVASFFMRQALPADLSCGPWWFMDCSCVEAFPTHSSCLLHGCYMFKTLLSSPSQCREGEWWVILLPSPLKAVLTLLP